jgi:ribosomal protein S18 acetylase RimI-like enzyme
MSGTAQANRRPTETKEPDGAVARYPRVMAGRVRKAGPSDGAGIGRVHAESWRVTYAGLLSPRYLAELDEGALAERWRRRLRSPSGDEQVLVAEIAGEVAGFCTFRACGEEPDLIGFAGEILMLYVHPAAQRRRVGRALFERARGELAARRLFWLVVWVVEGNHAARAFYRRVGLRPDGARRADVLGGESVAVVRYAGPLNPVIDFDALIRRRARSD